MTDPQATGKPAAGWVERRWFAPAAAAVIVLAVIAAYCNTLRCPFIFDDPGSIAGNPTIRSLSDLMTVLKADLPGGATPRGRPVVNLSLAINYAAGKLDVRGYHAANITIHALAALVLFGLVRQTLLLPGQAQRFARHAAPLAFAAALLWAVHPLQTESITYIIQRAESLMGLFFLLMLYCLCRAETSKRPWVWLAASVLACLLGMGSKEVMVVAPIVALLYDRTFLSSSFRRALRRRWPYYAALAMSWAMLGVFAWGARGETAGFDGKLSVWTYAATQLWAVARYLRLALWPGPLTLDYGTDTITSFWLLAGPGALVAALLTATALALWRSPKLGFLGAAFFLILAPSSSFIPVTTQTVAEHRMYLPLASVVILAVLGAHAAVSRLAAHRREWPAAYAWGLPAILAAAVAVPLGVRTFSRNADYRSERSIWQDTVRKRPVNARAHNNLATQLLRDGRPAEALEHLNIALGLDATYAKAFANRGSCRKIMGRLDLAIDDYTKAVKYEPTLGAAYASRSACWRLLQNYPEALADAEKAIAVEPDLALAYSSRGSCLMAMGRLAEALADFDKVLASRSNYYEAHYDKANCLVAMSRLEEAVAEFDCAIRGKPDFASAYQNRGVCYKTMGNFKQALEDLNRAIQLQPKYPVALNSRGVVLAQMGRTSDAFADWDRALALNPEYGEVYLNRAMVYCDLKDYDRSWQNLAQAQRLGAASPQFLQILRQASGRSH